MSALTLVALASASYALPAAAKSILAPHRAAYDMTLERTGASTGITALAGRMVFELKGNRCTGYEQSMRFVTETRDQSGKSTVSDQRSTFFEHAAKHQFRFQTDQYSNDRLSSQTRGQATRRPDQSSLKVRMKQPKGKELSFDRPVVFPVEHSIRLLEKAQSGARLYIADLYDGSEKGEKIYSTTAALGDRLGPGINRTLGELESASGLNNLAAWPVALSYFELGGKKRDAVPTYELSFLYFENGISRKLFIDYGTFSMRGRLVKLIMLPETPCDK